MSQYGAYGYALHGKSYAFILAHYYQGTSIATTDPKRIVRVLLATGPAAFAGAQRAGAARLAPAATYSVRANADGSLSVVGPAGKQLGRFAAPLTVTGSGLLALAGHGLYRGSFEFRPDGAGGVETVEALALEDYVRGVVAKEVPAGWTAEALKAQAVAARTYAITTNKGGGAFDQYADTRSQVYGGVAAETPTTDAAVAATSGEIVIYRGVPAVTYFYNSSGGHTENVEKAWPGASPEPWLRGVDDPYDAAGGDPYHAWGYDLPVASAAAKLANVVKGKLLGIRVTKQGSSPRIITADVVGSRGVTSVAGSELQRAFGLLTTNVAFTAISTSVGSSPHAAIPQQLPASPAGPVDARAMSALAPLVKQLLSGSPPTLTGAVFPAQPGEQFTVQRRAGARWVTVARARLGPGARFDLAPSAAGAFRILYRGLVGPSVTVR
jgi:stage II sporulation protein D